MPYVEISHSEYEKAAEVLGNNIARTGALRWWKVMEGTAILQAEWISGTGSRIWIEVPTITEID